MRVLTGFLTSIIVAAAAHAGPSFTANIEGAVDAPITAIEVTVDSELIIERAFTAQRAQDKIGPRDAERLEGFLTEALTKRYGEEGLMGESAEAGLTLKATITAVRANNPGWTQLGQQRNVSPAGSLSRGRADMTAQLVNTAGEVVATFSYDRQDLQLDQFSSRGAWTTARQAFRIFAKRSAETLLTERESTDAA